jgi:hypothetical protein
MILFIYWLRERNQVFIMWGVIGILCIALFVIMVVIGMIGFAIALLARDEDDEYVIGLIEDGDE